jgi:hypothetical protein
MITKNKQENKIEDKNNDKLVVLREAIQIMNSLTISELQDNNIRNEIYILKDSFNNIVPILGAFQKMKDKEVGYKRKHQ